MNKQKPRPKVRPISAPQRRSPFPVQKMAVKRSPQGPSRPQRPSRPQVVTRMPIKQAVHTGSIQKQPYRPPAKQAPLSSRPPMQLPIRQPAVAMRAANRQEIADTVLLDEVNVLESHMNSLANEISLEHHVNSVNELDQGILELPLKLEELRGQGYLYKNYLEKKISVIQEKWEAVESQVRSDLQRLSDELFSEYDTLVDRYNRAYQGGRADAGQIRGVNADLQALKSRLLSADSQLRSLYSNTHQTFYQTQSQLGMIEFLMDSIDQAKFALNPNEGPIQAVQAKWWRDGNNAGPEGILYLTDQRLLFEQKEEVATKKFLFITTESELHQEFLFEAPVVSVEDIQRDNRGIGGFQEHIDLRLGTGSPYPIAHFHLKGQPSEDWVVLIKKASTGEVSAERVSAQLLESSTEQDTAPVEAALAPEKCTSCGAPLPTLSATQRQHQCEYCATVMRW